MTSHRVRVWDAPTRIVHWSIAVLVAVSWWTAENGELGWHRYSGYAIVGLLAFRWYWAFAGGSTARLLTYVRGPRAVVAYARTLTDAGSPEARAGHNPLGALSALVLLLLLTAQVALGAFAVDVDGVESGPWSHLVSFDAGRACAEIHEDLFDVLAAFIALHVAAVLFYVFYRRQNLIVRMITGTTAAPIEGAGSLHHASAKRAFVGVALAVLIAWAFASSF